jgi:single-stranded-DNA-specific exonuclease
VGNGNKHLKLSLRREGSQKIFAAIGFSLGEKFSEIKVGDVLDVVFQLSENTWNGQISLQLKVIDMRPVVVR